MGCKVEEKRKRNIFYCQAFLSLTYYQDFTYVIKCKGIHNKIHFKGKKEAISKEKN